ncbi:hypothetical protein BC629DRAFT_87636 [Irpex lacteus]|nr:hypothetical protein BC629DRAFT_87636 [Irpex lacteus]
MSSCVKPTWALKRSGVGADFITADLSGTKQRCKLPVLVGCGGSWERRIKLVRLYPVCPLHTGSVPSDGSSPQRAQTTVANNDNHILLDVGQRARADSVSATSIHHLISDCDLSAAFSLLSRRSCLLRLSLFSSLFQPFVSRQVLVLKNGSPIWLL